MRLLLLALCAISRVGSALGADDYGFDPSQFEKQPYELNGFAELRAERSWLDRDAALYQLGFSGASERSSLDRGTGALELSGLYRAGIATFQGTVHGEAARDELDSDRRVRLYEGYLALQPTAQVRIEAGKRTLRWGKGYAWSPVGFVERMRDPNDPELSREGFAMAGASWVRSFTGPLQTLSLAAMAIPTGGQVNEEFGDGNHANPAARLSLLAYDTDIDIQFLGQGARSARYGLDLARNLSANAEIHGEWARVTDVARPVLAADGMVRTERADATSMLLGLRYLTQRETTWIAEVYRNGAGYTEAQMRDYFTFVHEADAQLRATGDTAALEGARALQTSYARANPMRNYLYLRVSQKDPFDILYFTPAVSLIANLDDNSRSLAPELTWTGVTNLELRLRLFVLSGGRLTDFGEKQNDQRVELRLRYYF